MAPTWLYLVLLTISVNSATRQTQAAHTDNEHPRRNLAYAVSDRMDKQILITGLDRLQYLLDANANNTELLKDMHRTFQKHSEYSWHLVLEVVASGADQTDQYVYYRFDRNNTELFVGGYRRC